MNMTRLTRIHTLAAVAGSLIATTASAQWTVTNLHANGSSSYALGLSGSQQIGSVDLGFGFISSFTAGLWNGSPESWVSLHPVGATQSEAYGISGMQQVGNARVGGVNRASLWSGTAESWVDLNPTDATDSVAYGISGIQQVGSALVGGKNRASLWSGSAESWVDLHPAGSQWSSSQAWATSGTHQVGAVRLQFGLWNRAALWSGTADSLIGLHPSGYNWSEAIAIFENQQVGYAGNGEFAAHAGLWTGTAESWVSLHPAVAEVSSANGTTGSQQVGWAEVDGVRRASLWSGTADSWEDLSLALPGSWLSTEATGIWSDGETLYISGYGSRVLEPGEVRTEALLWTRAIPAPGVASLLAAAGVFGGRRRRA